MFWGVILINENGVQYFFVCYAIKKNRTIVLVMTVVIGGYSDSSLAFCCTAATKGFCHKKRNIAMSLRICWNDLTWYNGWFIRVGSDEESRITVVVFRGTDYCQYVVQQIGFVTYCCSGISTCESPYWGLLCSTTVSIADQFVVFENPDSLVGLW